MSKEEFRNRYQNFPTDRLLKITLQPDAYQEAALQAAEEELARREVDEAEITAARDAIGREANEQATRAFQRRTALDRVRANAGDWAAAASPIQTGTKDVLRRKRIVTILLGLAALLTLFQTAVSFGWYLSDPSYVFDIFAIATLVITLCTAVVPVLFWLGKRIGWMVAVGFSSLSAASGLSLFVQSVAYYYSYVYSAPAGFNETDLSGLVQLFEPAQPHLLLFGLLYYVAILWLLTRPGMIALFQIGPTARTRTYLVSGALAVCVLVLVAA